MATNNINNNFCWISYRLAHNKIKRNLEKIALKSIVFLQCCIHSYKYLNNTCKDESLKSCPTGSVVNALICHQNDLGSTTGSAGALTRSNKWVFSEKHPVFPPTETPN